jgi:lipoate-protein ligase A
MALDEWLLNQHLLGLQPPTLRFYTWSPVAISLGYHQRRYPEIWQQLSWNGEVIDLVRRPSGGRAVLHQGDLTYAVITSGIAGSRMQIYQTICEFLIQGWRRLGVDLNYGLAGRGYIHNPDCFGTATGADLVMPNGMKLIGSAQLHRDGAVLQHGSIRLDPDPELFHRVFGTKLPQSVSLIASSMNGLSQEQLIQAVIEALVEAASQCFGVELVTQPLTETEWQTALAQSGSFKVGW